MGILFWKKKKESKGTEGVIGSQIGAFASRHQAAASDAAVEGMDLFREAAGKLLNVAADKKQGNLFEYIEATKFNMDAASKGSGVRAFVTAAEGNPHAPEDIQIRLGDKVLDRVQAKSSNSAARATRMISDEKYNGMQKVVNSDKVDKVRELAESRSKTGNIYSNEYADTAKNLKGGVTHGDIKSGGTSHPETMEAASNPERYANKLEMSQFKKEIGVTTANAAAAGAIMGGALSVIKNGVALSKGEVETGEAALNVLKDSGKSAARGGATGLVGAGIRIGAQKAGVSALAKSNVATSIAAGVIDIGATVYSFAKGDISGEEAVEKVGQSGISTASSIYAGAAAGMVFGPVGAVVGSIAGYMVATNVYQACLAIYDEAELAEEEAQRVIALCEEASREMQRQRAEFEHNAREKLKLNEREFKKCFSAIDLGLKASNPEKAIYALSDFAELFDKKLRLTDFDEFDDFMKDDTVLRL